MPKRVQISINIEDCVSQNRRVVWSPAACDSLGVYMRRITYDSATVNISVFIEQRNISFQNDISLKKPWDWGVSSWKKLKHRETHGRIVSLEQTGSRKAIADLFVMFIAWTSQKASKVHSANLKHSKSTRRQSSCASREMYKISTSRNGNEYPRQLSFWYRALSCGADWFTKGVYIWVTHLHIAVPTVTCSLRYT